MTTQELHVVTGAFGYTGKYITRRLLKAGQWVRTLTNSPHRANPFGERVKAYPFSFDDPARLVEALDGAAVLYNTYWVRFNHRMFKQADAIANTMRLFAAAKEAGVSRVVHISVTNPSEDSPLQYFRGKAILERALIESALSYAILRPALLFGHEDVLINNIAWMLRKLPVFGVFGDGRYRLQPIYVEDLAELAVEHGQGSDNVIIDAIGPDTLTYRNLVETIAAAIGKRRPIVSIPLVVGCLLGWVLGKVQGDVTITREEIQGLMANLLCTDSTPTGHTRLTEWADEHAAELGIRYANELVRRTDKLAPYEQL